MKSFTYYVKRLIFTQIYCDFYPLINKPQICEKLNNCGLTDGSKEAMLKSKILEYLDASINNNELDKEIKEKEIKTCHRKKKAIRYGDDGKKYKVKVDKIRLGFSEDEKKYSEELNVINEEQDNLKTLYINIYEGNISEKDLEMIDEIISEHRLNLTFEIIIAFIAVAIIAFLIIRKYIF